MHLAPFTGLRITNPQRHTMFFTATWPMSIRRLASEFLRNPAPWRRCDQVFQWTQWTCLWNKSECDECTFSHSFWTMWVQYGEPPKLLNLLSAAFRQRHDRLRSKFRSETAMSSRGTRSVPFILKSWYIHINGETFPVSTTDE